MIDWHTKSNEEVFRELKSSEKGLTNKELNKRIEKYGKNEILEKRKTPRIFIFLKQFNNPLIYILIVAMIISFMFKHKLDGYIILGIILVNAIISFVEEGKAEKAIDSLKKMIVSYARVYRDNGWVKMASSNLVPGDIIFLEAGDKVPADARLIECKNLKTQEASLTGESFPMDKKNIILSNKISLGDRVNMVFYGTLVVSGEAKAIVVSTGQNTAIGQIAESIQEIVQPKMHFQEKMSRLAVQMGIFASVGAILTFLIGYFWAKQNLFDVFLFSIASLVSGIPEGLPAVLMIVLSIGTTRMARKNAIIRHLPAVETLGVATVIATDKTGTLTENSMTIEKIITAEGNFEVSGEGWKPEGEITKEKKKISVLNFKTLNKLINISALCNKGNISKKGKDYEILGDPTEVALIVLGGKVNIEKENFVKNIIDDFPFDSELKLRASLIKEKNKTQIYSVGAFERILDRCSHVLERGGKFKINIKNKNEFMKKALELAKQGYRVLGICYKDTKVKSIVEENLKDFVFVGFVAMKDPPRKEVKNSIKKAQNAGIRIIMKTGDHKETAFAIAREIGLVTEGDKIMTGEDLEKLSKKEFSEVVKTVNVFARVTPKMKMKIIQTLQEQGEVVAMTGDGVNDAPALKKADIGIAMGLVGTDVARESSEMVLADDDFSSIVDAIAEGRTVFRNIKRTSFYLVTTNVAEDITIVSSLSLGLPLPMLPIQLLYLNLVTDTFNGVALAAEPTHEDVLNEAPRNKKQRILNMDILPFLILIAGLMAFVTIPLFKYFLGDGLDKARTVAFVSMSMFQLFNVLNMRSIKKSVFKIGLFTNKWVILSLGVSLVLMFGIIYLPFTANIFQFASLKLWEIGLIVLATSSVFVFGELYKLIRFREKKI